MVQAGYARGIPQEMREDISLIIYIPAGHTQELEQVNLGVVTSIYRDTVCNLTVQI